MSNTNISGRLILEDGSVFTGYGLGTKSKTTAEFVFNTGMTGYYDMLSDPANLGLGIVTTFPVIGSWGTPYSGKRNGGGAAALICREISFCPPNNLNEQDINDFMLSMGITGLSGIDTRQLTRHLRKSGSMTGMITFDEKPDIAAAVKEIKAYKISGLVKQALEGQKAESKDGTGKKLAVVNFGSADKTISGLTEMKYGVNTYLAGTAADIILKDKPDGIILTNGPGDPKDCLEFLPMIKKLTDSGVPVFGIGLGHQLMALAKGFDTYKLPHGHRGANYPVNETATGKMYITTQNHGYAVELKSVKSDIATVSYTNINDNTVAGLEYKGCKCASLQYFPDCCRYVLKPNAGYLKFLSTL